MRQWIPGFALAVVVAACGDNGSSTPANDVVPQRSRRDPATQPLRRLAAAANVAVGTRPEGQTGAPEYDIRVVTSAEPDRAIQSKAFPRAAAPALGVGFDGIGNGVAGFVVNSAPPDTNGAVGPNHYVDFVNSAFAVYAKTGGAPLYGPVGTNTIWSGFGGGCQTNNDGDAVVEYDRRADRWVVTPAAAARIVVGSVLACSAWSRPVLMSGRFVTGSTGNTGICGELSV